MIKIKAVLMHDDPSMPKINIVYNLDKFMNPMEHLDWHNAEASKLKFLRYIDSGKDYWKDELLFCSEELFSSLYTLMYVDGYKMYELTEIK